MSAARSPALTQLEPARLIRQVNSDGLITTVARELNDPIGAFVDAAGVLYIADTFNARIKTVRVSS